MRLAEPSNSKDKVAVTVWSRTGKLTKKGKQSHTFTVEDTSMDELSDNIKDWIRGA